MKIVPTAISCKHLIVDNYKTGKINLGVFSIIIIEGILIVKQNVEDCLAPIMTVKPNYNVVRVLYVQSLSRLVESDRQYFSLVLMK